jgi:hypothetical protein
VGGSGFYLDRRPKTWLVEMRFQRLVPAFRRVPRRFSIYQLRIGRSRVHRFGVFTLDAIPKGATVIEYQGKRLTRAQAVRNAKKPGVRINAYLVRLNSRCVLDGSRGGSGAEFINHSCDPNLHSKRRRGKLLLVSRRSISQGEELTWDYAYSRKLPLLKCRCGSDKCRGTLNRAGGKSGGESRQSMSTLADFLLLLSSNPQRLTEFINNPQESMRRARLSVAERKALTSGSASRIRRALGVRFYGGGKTA